MDADKPACLNAHRLQQVSSSPCPLLEGVVKHETWGHPSGFQAPEPGRGLLKTAVQERFSLQLPEYPGTACCVRIGGSADTAAGTSNRGGSQGGGDVAAMRQNYDKGGLAEEDAPADPMQMFDR